VTGVTYRHPGVLAHTVATLDVLSGGRARLGIGAAWYEREHHALGVPFPAVGDRFDLLEDTLELCRQMFSDVDGPYRGRVVSSTETICEPRPVRQVPVMVGGGGEQRTLRLVARHADACNLGVFDLEEVRHKLGVLDRWCEVEGRDPSTVDRTVMWVADPIAERERFLGEMEAVAGLGVSEVMVIPPGDPVRFVGDFAEAVLPDLAGL
jgi:alkanesulfonate monooxygenase SsuD/methylene tetrahydromethanopterin reductase-like flavin-dependent oxidoreductase (luciferase family)